MKGKKKLRNLSKHDSPKLHKKVFQLGELFCGAGGLSLGLARAVYGMKKNAFAIQHVWAIDNHHDACETYRYNICPESPEIVREVDVREPNLIESLPPINALAFGFPCNDFSLVGEQKGLRGNYGPLYSYGVKAIREFQPEWFIAENVGGLQSSGDGRSFLKILQDLKSAIKIGYELTVHLYKFEEYGIPQRRHRIIIVGMRRDLGLQFRVPAPTHIGEENQVSAQSALEEQPIPRDIPNQELTRQSSVVVERLKLIKPGQNVWNAKLPPSLRLNVKGAKLSQIYRRLEPNKPSYTVTGSGGGGTHVYHWNEPRALTNRERARLQSFPDEFVFLGSKESVRKQIGMAVPPLAAEVIARALMMTYAGESYPWIHPRWDSEFKRGESNQMTFLD